MPDTGLSTLPGDCIAALWSRNLSHFTDEETEFKEVE